MYGLIKRNGRGLLIWNKLTYTYTLVGVLEQRVNKNDIVLKSRTLNKGTISCQTIHWNMIELCQLKFSKQHIKAEFSRTFKHNLIPCAWPMLTNINRKIMLFDYIPCTYACLTSSKKCVLLIKCVLFIYLFFFNFFIFSRISCEIIKNLTALMETSTLAPHYIDVLTIMLTFVNHHGT